MNDEIREILDNFKNYEERYKKCNETQFIIFYRDIHILLDYITNLQQRNNNLKEDFKRHINRINELTERNDNLQQENEKLKDELEWWKQQCDDLEMQAGVDYE